MELVHKCKLRSRNSTKFIQSFDSLFAVKRETGALSKGAKGVQN